MLDALIPYLEMPSKTLVDDLPVLGTIKLQVFGPLVAVGVILGYRRCLKFAKVKDMDEFLVRDLMFWILVAGFVISHWISVIFYFPHQLKENPWTLLTVWNGLSSVGGFFGAVLGMIWFLRKHKQPIIPFADLLMYGLLLGWCFGRAGCSLVHDHPGKIVDPPTLFSVGPWPPPNGPHRYDLGLYEWAFTVVLTSYVYFFSSWQKWKPGFLTGLVATVYAPVRFFLDFLRADEHSRVGTPDLRYAGLTTAQWFTVAILLVGIWLLLRKPRPEDSEYAKDSDRIAREKKAEAEKKGEKASAEDASAS